MYLYNDVKTDHTYDAIVVGSGISGGWAAKELTEKGLKTLVLERGRNIEHIKDYDTAMTPPWGFKHRGQAYYGNEKDPPCSKPRLSLQRTQSFLLGQ